MPWWDILRRTPTQPAADQTPPAQPPVPRTARHGIEAPQQRSAPLNPAAMDPETRKRRLAVLEARREAALYDIEQAELAQQPDNPWQQRIELLTESLATVEADRQRLAALPPEPTFDVPALPVTGIAVETNEPAQVTFAVGGQRFAFAEEIDWDNRGGTVVRGDLRLRDGDPAALLPAGVPDDLRATMRQAIENALVVFAVALRDLALDGEPLPATVTLDQILTPDPEVGGWKDWTGTNPIRVQRAYRMQQLRTEAQRLEKERRDEAEARRTLIDRLPIARKRLADAEAEIEALTGNS